jgi:hypothetical protein
MKSIKFQIHPQAYSAHPSKKKTAESPPIASTPLWENTESPPLFRTLLWENTENPPIFRTPF